MPNITMNEIGTIVKAAILETNTQLLPAIDNAIILSTGGAIRELACGIVGIYPATDYLAADAITIEDSADLRMYLDEFVK